MRYAPLFVALTLFAGCSNAPITVPLQDFDVPIATIQSGQALFTKQNFNRPPIPLSAVALEGSLTYQQGNVSLRFYAAEEEPCTPTSGVYLCNTANPKIEQAGNADFQSGATQPLRLSGDKLTRGINNGSLWIGVKLESGIATAGTLEFRNMVAKVALIP